jgi:hypothetical protein
VVERKTWTVKTEDGSHEVELRWTYWSGHREVAVDGVLKTSNSLPLRWKSEQRVDIDGHEAVIRTRPSMPLSAYFTITLELDGVEVPPNEGSPSQWESKRARSR